MSTTTIMHTQLGVAPHESISQSSGPQMRKGSLIDIEEVDNTPEPDVAPAPKEAPDLEPEGIRSRSSSTNPFRNEQGVPIEIQLQSEVELVETVEVEMVEMVEEVTVEVEVGVDLPVEAEYWVLLGVIGQGIKDALKNQSAPPSSDKSWARVQDPGTFNGKDPDKLRTFLFPGILNFKDRPSAFVRDYQKVNYMISYLTGGALGWFEPSIVDPDPENIPTWLNNYDTFVSELQLNPSTYDP
ncbi:hypothetical protein DFH08DRAFT_963163 [Mycena albidolilacea]|uniref:DUF4939 domain-containing protein n=1 Tax=Mycena albidolilacea TaxID=1033008 RepID=A0AAD6ZWG7_9AGAR|nr:hypothetical protein DFH08DRAFT_963163 [Mycena albidolilacea]